MRVNPSTLKRFVSVRTVSLAGLAALLALQGCSPTTRFYTLSQIGSDAASQAPATAASALVGIGPIALPGYVDRPQIVVRTGANTVHQATFDQWGGSLDGMVPQVLVDDLALRLPDDHFVSFPQSGDLPFDFRVPVSISQFDVSSSGEAVVAAQWQVRGKAVPGGVMVRETVARSQAEGEGFQQRVAALSVALGMLTDEIAAALAPLPRQPASVDPASP